MAHNTPLYYRNLVLYEVYVRNHGPNGAFADIETDLPRIRGMGVDVLWLMPIHPIGQVNRKGRLGSPYSIADYREVNPEYGSRADLARLIEKAHQLGLKVMLDVVYNHTAHDSRLVQEHPEWFHCDEHGTPTSTVPEWSDVIDLKHPNPALSAYLIAILQKWATLGVDGFRCDVASLLPLEFWQQARYEVDGVKPGMIWLAESVHAAFVAARRAAGLTALSDSELYQVFDITYDYDIWPIWQAAVRGKVPVGRYLEMLRYQDSIYPANFVKLRCVENHDQARIMALAPSRSQALAWTAFQAFNKGAFLIYAGQEAGAIHTPSLFDTDKIQWESYALQPFLTLLAHLKKDPALTTGQFVLLSDEPVIQATWFLPGNSLYGVFNTNAASGQTTIRLPDGTYTDLLSGTTVRVQHRKITIPPSAAILRYTDEIALQPFYSDLLDYHVEPQ